MGKVSLEVNGKSFEGWKAVSVTLGIESIAGSFSLEVTDRWAREAARWPIKEGNLCKIKIEKEKVLTGYIDARSISISATDRSLSVSGRSKAGDLVDCSAVLDVWEFQNLRIDKIVEKLAAPFGIRVSVAAGVKLPAPQMRFAINPGEAVFEAIDRICRLSSILPISDGDGNIILTKPGVSRAASSVKEGINLKSASADFSADQRFYRYVAAGQHTGTDDFFGDNSAGPLAESFDKNVRKSRVMMLRPEGLITADSAKTRAAWEANVRAAKAGTVSATVQGWRQENGTRWPINARVKFDSPSLGLAAELLITEINFSLDEGGGEITRMTLKRKDAYTPEPQIEKDPWDLTDEEE